MIKIRNNAIHITRGDSANINVTVANSDGTSYSLQDGDTITFTVKKTTSDKDAIISKNLSDNVIHIVPSDTSALEYGNYVYDCQLTTATGAVCTFIAPTLFKVEEEVTF